MAREWRRGDGHPLIGSCVRQQGLPGQGPGIGPDEPKVVQNRTAYGKTDFATARRGLCWPNAAPTSAFRMSLVPFVLFPPEGLKRDDET